MSILWHMDMRVVLLFSSRFTDFDIFHTIHHLSTDQDSVLHVCFIILAHVAR